MHFKTQRLFKQVNSLKCHFSFFVIVNPHPNIFFRWLLESGKLGERQRETPMGERHINGLPSAPTWPLDQGWDRACNWGTHPWWGLNPEPFTLRAEAWFTNQTNQGKYHIPLFICQTPTNPIKISSHITTGSPKINQLLPSAVLLLYLTILYSISVEDIRIGTG